MPSSKPHAGANPSATVAQRLLTDLRGRRTTIFGLGREGLDLALFLAQEGASVLVTDVQSAETLRGQTAILDDLGIATSLGGHPVDQVLEADILFVSPGIVPEIHPLREARRRGIPVSSATQLFFTRCEGRIVGITGSSGKSTTTALVGEMLARADRRVVVGGNIGQPLLGRLADIDAETLVVMELSSFQLETIDRSPGVATITNITPNHLDRHLSMDAYISAKKRIFQFQRENDWCALNADDPVSATLRPPGRIAHFSLQDEVDGAFLSNNRLRSRTGGETETICRADEIVLRGRHNLANTLTACAIAGVLGVGPGAMREVLLRFSGLPHRLQKVGEHRSVCFYDDSIATSPERSIAGLASFNKPVVLLAGGRDKHLPMDTWAAAIRDRARGVVLFGEAVDLIESALASVDYPTDRVRRESSLQAAVRASLDLAQPGDVVLLSPGCTSYDMFKDFVERGQAFAHAVGQLSEQRS